MDHDITDILASVSARTIDPRTLDLQALTRAWVNERTAPELLPYPTELIERVMGRVGKQISIIEEMSGSLNPKANFTLVILQTELERFKFLIRSFLRARIAKIDKYPLHYRNQIQNLDIQILSPLESQYLHSHSALLSTHYTSSFLSSFPSNLQSLEDSSMIDKPDEDTALFCRVLRDVEKPVEVYGEGGTGTVELRRGDVWVLRWGSVKGGVRGGDVELI